MDQSNNKDNLHDEVDLGELFQIFWSNKILIGSLTSIVAILSVLYALSLPNVYSSSSLLAPTSQEDSLSSKLGGISGLAGFAGISLPAGGISQSQIAVKRMQSFEFFATYFLPNIKLQNLLALEQWISRENILIYDKDIYDAISNKWLRQVSYPKEAKPSAQEAYKEYKKILGITQDELTGLVDLSIEHKSPIIAKKWVDIIIYNINESMREMDKQDAQNSINFLNESTKTVRIQSIKEVIGSLLEVQMQTLMLTSSSKAYIFKTINSPIVPEEKSGPGRSLICILGTILGLILSLLVVLIKHLRQISKK